MTKVCAGSADRCVYLWDSEEKKAVGEGRLPLYRLPGHKATVAEVGLHPSEPVVVSSGLDGQIFLGEL